MRTQPLARAAPLAVALAAVLAAAGCGCDPTPAGGDGGDGGVFLADGGAPPIAGLVALVVSPATAELVTDGTARPEQSFVVTGRFAGGSERDVTDEVGLSLSEPSLGALDGARFVSAGLAGRSALVARAGAMEGRAEITVRLDATFEEEPAGTAPLPDDPGAVFDGAPNDDGRKPRVVYPNDGVLLPPNMGVLEVHFLPGNGNELFEVAFAGPELALRVFTRCASLGQGCLYTPSPEVWRLLAESSRGGAPVTVRVRGTDDGGSGTGASDEIEMRFAAADVEGALYYWTTTRRAIMRVDFGATEQVPEQFYPTEGGGPCYGCHALSPDGHRMSLSQDGQWRGEITVLDVGSQTVLVGAAEERREQFQSWDPTSTKFAAIYGDGDPVDHNIRIRHGTTGEVLETIPVSSEVSHPSWSPAGDRIAFTVVTIHYSSQRPGRGGLSYVKQEGATWSEPIELLAPVDGKNRYTPAYSPDGSFLLYVESLCAPGETYNAACDADADDVAKLWALRANGGEPVYLENANRPGPLDEDDDLANTFPRWAPFVDALNADGTGRVMWMTFSSRRQYGLRDPEGKQLLWMVAVDPDKVLAGEDGSFPAFVLPFQDITTSNHMAQWAEQYVPTAPDAGVYVPEDDGGEACVAVGESCEPNVSVCCDGALCLGSTESGFFCTVIGG